MITVQKYIADPIIKSTNKKELCMEALHAFKEKAKNELGLQFYAIGLKGSQNYNLDEKDSDFDANLVFIPTLKQIRTNKVYNIKTEFGECVCHNIYSFAKIVAKGNPQWIEVCNTPYKIGNFAIFKKYKLNPTALQGMAQNKQKAFSHLYPSRENVVKEFGYDPKQLLHVVRLYDCLVSDKPYTVYNGDARNHMLAIKKGLFTKECAEMMLKEYMYKIKELCEQKAKDFKQQDVEYDILDKIVIKNLIN